MKRSKFVSLLVFIVTGIVAVPEIASVPRKWGEMGPDLDRWTQLLDGWEWWNFVFLAIASLSLLYATSGFWLPYLVAEKSVEEIPKNYPNPLQANDRNFTEKSAREIFNDLDDLTSMKEEERAKFYMGKWLRVQGVIDDISQYEAVVTIRFSAKRLSFRSVDMAFSDESTCARLRTLDKGDRLAVIGKITYANSLSIELTDCELVENSPKDDKLK